MVKHQNKDKRGRKLNNFIIIVGLFFIASSLFLLVYSLQKDKELKEINMSKVENFKIEREKQNKDYLKKSDKFSNNTVGDLKNEISNGFFDTILLAIDEAALLLIIFSLPIRALTSSALMSSCPM